MFKMENNNQNTDSSRNDGNTMLAEVLLKNEKKLGELDHERKFYENFYQFNKITGLGKIYRQTQLKVKICIRLLNFRTCQRIADGGELTH